MSQDGTEEYRTGALLIAPTDDPLRWQALVGSYSRCLAVGEGPPENWCGGSSDRPGRLTKTVVALDATGTTSSSLSRYVMPEIQRAPGPTGAMFRVTGGVPVVGDWNGDGVTDIGFYDSGDYSHGFHLGVITGSRVVEKVFGYTAGPSKGYQPVTGDWNGDGVTDVGVTSQARNSAGILGYRYLTTTLNSSGKPTGSVPVDYRPAFVTNPVPLTGDWNGDGKDEPALTNSTGSFYLSARSAGTARVWERIDTGVPINALFCWPERCSVSTP